MRTRKALILIGALGVALAVALAVAGCTDDAPGSGQATPRSTSAPTSASEGASTEDAAGSEAEATYCAALTLAYDDSDLDASWDGTSSSFIMLAEDSITFVGRGAKTSANAVTIAEAGTYVISGTASDAQLIVDSEEAGLVRLVLNGVDMTCPTSAPIYVKSAEKVVLILADGTENAVADGPAYALEGDASDEPNAAIFSDPDLTINGTGSLTVIAHHNDGITSKDDLKIVSGSLTVDAVNDAIKGKDCLGVKEADITVAAGGDGMQSTDATAVDKGFICISGGIIEITAGADGIQAATTLLVSSGDLTISTGGGSANAPAHAGDFGDTGGNWGRDQNWGGGRRSTTSTTMSTDGSTGSTTATTTWSGETDSDESSSSDSAKALKAGSGVFIDGGTITVDSSDDAVHSNNAIQINGGTLTLASGDDGIHADASIEINGGDIGISESYEGIESNVITLNGGIIHIVSSDDGINGVTSATSDGAASGQGRGGFTESGDARLTINGGYTAIDARGDGMDINGTVAMTDGVLIINGPTENVNGALDYYADFNVSGGFLVAVGSSGMAEAPSESSSQYSIMVGFDQVQAAGTIVHIEDANGSDIITFASSKQFQSVVFSSSALTEGTTYGVYLGGTCTGTVTDSLYAGGTYEGGTEYTSVTISSIVTTAGSVGRMMPGGMGGGTPPSDGTMPGGGPRGAP